MDKEDLKNNPEYLSDVCKGLEELRVHNKEDIRVSQIEAFKAANRITSDLNKYLFTVTTLLITIIFSLMGVQNILKSLSQADGTLIKESLIFLFLSLLLGFMHMISERRFFEDWLYTTEKQLKLWSSLSFWPSAPIASKIKDYIIEYDSVKGKVDEISSDMKKTSTNIFIILQGVFWTIGVAKIVIVAFKNLP